MPILDLGKNPLTLWDPVYIYSIMMYPNKPDKRNQIQSAWKATLAATHPGSVEMDADTIMSLLNSPTHESLFKQSALAGHNGWVAGNVLIWLHYMKQGGIEPSLSKAIYLQDKIHRDVKTYNGWKLARQKRTDPKDEEEAGKGISYNWKLFKSVAHLWAAFTTCSCLIKDNPKEDRALLPILQHPDIFPGFLFLSKQYREMGEGLIIKGRSASEPTILNAKETWRIPKNYALPDTPVLASVMPVPSWLEEELAGYSRKS
jgi:hypothetical protein